MVKRLIAGAWIVLLPIGHAFACAPVHTGPACLERACLAPSRKVCSNPATNASHAVGPLAAEYLPADRIAAARAEPARH